ncbi:MAG: class I SAM-dependent methyltransferase [Sporomusaceae bacterium]|nr:class I SAM-dependent methyltransferase [Sporomusaceae bacterium]
MIRNAVMFVQHILKERVAAATCLVDATCGNGWDTLYLAQHSPDTAKIYAFDIQAQAVSATKERLIAAGLDHKVTILLDSHERIDQYVRSIDIALFNLGYLPKGGHELTTKAATTLQAVERILPLLQPGGMIALVAYPGHEEGQNEAIALKEFLSSLPQTDYYTGIWQMLNQIHQPPLLYLVEKTRSERCERVATRED